MVQLISKPTLTAMRAALCNPAPNKLPTRVDTATETAKLPLTPLSNLMRCATVFGMLSRRNCLKLRWRLVPLYRDNLPQGQELQMLPTGVSCDLECGRTSEQVIITPERAKEDIGPQLWKAE